MKLMLSTTSDALSGPDQTRGAAAGAGAAPGAAATTAAGAPEGLFDGASKLTLAASGCAGCAMGPAAGLSAGLIWMRLWLGVASRRVTAVGLGNSVFWSTRRRSAPATPALPVRLRTSMTAISCESESACRTGAQVLPYVGPYPAHNKTQRRKAIFNAVCRGPTSPMCTLHSYINGHGPHGILH